MIYKFSLEWGYKNIIYHNRFFNYDFDTIKYIIGTIWVIILFFSIKHSIEKVSSFFLYFVYIFQIIPITVIYALGNKSNIYYNVLCSCFLVTGLIVGSKDIDFPKVNSRQISNLLRFVFIGIVVVLFLEIFRNNGFPTLIALNIYDVYELRSSGWFKISKYMHYVLSVAITVILPFLLSQFLLNKKYLKSIFIVLLQLLLYLYTGHKTMLFSAPFILITYFISKRKNLYFDFFNLICLGVFSLTLIAKKHVIFRNIFDLLCRRSLLATAYNKFAYYNFFSRNPKLGFAGMFPRWLINIKNPYEGRLTIGQIISADAYNVSAMDANTGFLAEGYMRFGYIGILISFLVLALLFKLMDSSQKSLGYKFEIIFLIYFMFTLCDAHLIDKILFGPVGLVILILVFYSSNFDCVRK